MRILLSVILIPIILCGCGQTHSGPKDRWSWLPQSPEAASDTNGVATNVLVTFSIPAERPLRCEGVGTVTSAGQFGMPQDKASFTVQGGELESRIGSLSRKAKFGGWDYLYADAARSRKLGWGFCVTDGEVLLPLAAFAEAPTNAYVQNCFEMERISSQTALVRLDSSKGHRLCFWRKPPENSPTGVTLFGAENLRMDSKMTISANFVDLPTAGFVGSKASAGGRTVERRSDGWYDGKKRLAE